MKIFTWGLVTMAIGVLVAGILAGLYIMNISSLLPAATVGLQSPAMKPFWDTLVSGFHVVGSSLLVFGVVLGILLLAVAFLLARNHALVLQLSRLEASLDASNADRDLSIQGSTEPQRSDQ